MRSTAAVASAFIFLSGPASAQSMPKCDEPDIVKKLEASFVNSLSDNGKFKAFKNFREVATADKPPEYFSHTYGNDSQAVKGVKYCEATAVLNKDSKGDYEDLAYIAIIDMWNSSAKTHAYQAEVCASLFYSPDSKANCPKQRPAK